MRYFKYLALLAVCAFALATPSQAQVRVGVGIGVGPVYGGYAAPVCAYGYYGYAPYACAPYGYYGPSWFAGGIFIGAGPGSTGLVEDTGDAAVTMAAAATTDAAALPGVDRWLHLIGVR